MKKLAIIASLLLAASSPAVAQTQLVKDVKQQAKSVKDYDAYKKLVETLKPAFTNPETANSAETYYVPGKTGFDVYDAYILQKSLGGDIDTKAMGRSLLDGYNFFMKAFEYDSLPDAKGKVKPKFSKDMVNVIVGHVNDFDQAAVGFWQARDYEGAYEAWDALLDIPSNPRYAKSNIKHYPDTVIAEIRYNQGLAAWQAGRLDSAMTAFDKSIALGNTNPQLFEYAYSVAYAAKNKEAQKRYAREGFNRFGTSDPRFLQWTVNGYIEDKDFDTATKMLKDAIAADPNNGAYYYSAGILEESRKNNDAAKVYYQKGIELNPDFPGNYLNLGRVLAEEYDALDQATGNMSQADYNKYAAETLVPLLKESAKNFERAYEINNELDDALKYLKNIYYRLNDNANYERVNKLLGY